MSAREILLDKCRRVSPENANELIDEIERYCKKLGKRAHPEEFIGEINLYVRDAFSPETQERVKTLLAANDHSLDDDEEEDPQYLIEMSEAIFGDIFKKVMFDWGEIAVHEIIDEENKTLREIAPQSEARFVLNKAGQRLKQIGQPVTVRQMKELYSYWEIYGDQIARPKLMAQPDEDVFCYHKTLVVPEPGPCPTFDHFGKRMSDYEAWAAWIYGVYSGQNEGRQVLWFRGQHGTDGKTFVSKIIAENLFGSCANVFNNAVIAGDKRFITSFFEKAALIVYGDANDPTILMSELMKQISAGKEGDKVPIEPKGKQMRPAQLESRVWVNSNKMPDVPDEPSILSRLLYIEIAPLEEEPDRTLREKFIAELPQFLHFAKQCYEERCPRNDEIVTNERTQELVSHLIAAYYEKFDHVFDRYFQWGEEEDFVYGEHLYETLRKSGITGRYEQQNFYDYLKRNAVVKKKDSSDGGKWKYYGMFRKGQRKPSEITKKHSEKKKVMETPPDFGV